ncbi:MAG: YggS family pyridoxal phosphate-dependent enzyme [Oscillospiraceae bacterium]|nr:YggS family pyridoxal phosphate-dependent enzyme [Oscillospiraceae bacterium]
MSVAENVALVRERIQAAALAAGRDPAEITLSAATKVQTSETIREVIAAGVTVCSENHVQEFVAHQKDGAYEGAKVHIIGHLQTNKLKYVVGKVDLIESVDSLHLLEAISRQAVKLGVTQDILLEVNIGREASKTGIPPEEVLPLAEKAVALPGVRLRGLMAIPPISPEPGANRPFFAEIFQLFVDIRANLVDNREDIICLSMGMSQDYEDAIAEGATLIRVGTALFGPRPPKPAQAPPVSKDPA